MFILLLNVEKFLTGIFNIQKYVVFLSVLRYNRTENKSEQVIWVEKKQDLRVKKTKAAIHNAFLELLAEKGFGSITVKDIAESAEINRKTFYFHYDTKEDVYNEIMTEVLDSISRQSIFETLSHSEPHKQQELIVLFLKRFKMHKREILIFMNDDTNTAFNDNLKKRLQKALVAEEAALKRLKNDGTLFQLLTDVYFDNFTRVLKWWLESGQDDPMLFIGTIMMLFSSEPLEMLGLKVETLNEYGNIH